MFLPLHNRQKLGLKRILTTLTKRKTLKKIVLSWSILPVIYTGLVVSSDGSYEPGVHLSAPLLLLPMARFFSEYPTIEPMGQITIRFLPKAFNFADNTSSRLRIDTKADTLLAFSVEGPVTLPVPLNGDLLLSGKEGLDDFFESEEVRKVIKELSEQNRRQDNIKKEARQRSQLVPSIPPTLKIRWQCDDVEVSQDTCSVYFEIDSRAEEDHEEGELLLPLEEDTGEEGQSLAGDLRDQDSPEPGVSKVILNKTIVCKFPDIGCYPVPASPNILWNSSPSENSGDEKPENEEPENEEPENEEPENEEPDAGKNNPDGGSADVQQDNQPCYRHLSCYGKQRCLFRVVYAPADSTTSNIELPVKNTKLQYDQHPLECPYSKCKKKFTIQSRLKQHQIQVHPTEDQLIYRCLYPECKKAFAAGWLLNHHQKVSHPTEDQLSYKCPYPGCHKKFAYRSNLTHHQKGKHRSVKKATRCLTGNSARSEDSR